MNGQSEGVFTNGAPMAPSTRSDGSPPISHHRWWPSPGARRVGTVTTQVEIRFGSEAGGTRVELEHSGWEQSEKTRDARGNYDSGWDKVLGHYQAAFAASDEQKAESR